MTKFTFCAHGISRHGHPRDPKCAMGHRNAVIWDHGVEPHSLQPCAFSPHFGGQDPSPSPGQKRRHRHVVLGASGSVLQRVASRACFQNHVFDVADPHEAGCVIDLERVLALRDSGAVERAPHWSCRRLAGEVFTATLI